MAWQESTAAKAGVFAALVAGLVLIAAVSGGVGNPLRVLVPVLLLSPVWVLALAALLLLHSRLERSAARRLPPGPGQPGADRAAARRRGAG
jgi:hypothetical protein